MAKALESLSVAVMKKIDAICDRFEAEWKAGKKPTIEKQLDATTGKERAELLRMLLKLELELQGTGKKSSQATYEARFPADTTVVQSVFRDFSERTTSHRAAASADTSVSKDSVPSVSTKAYVPEETPKNIGRFEILEVLGQGAFGRVYKARDPQLDRHVAIKVPLQGALGSQEEIDRFLREARAAATLHHPNLCPVHEVGQDDSGAYHIVMAYVDGKTLSAYLKERKEPVAAKQAALIVRKLALALGAAHAKGIVHRDLKPSNIMIERERKDVIIMDFGLARHRKKGDAKETREGVVMGTPAYMSPEQARGDVKAIGPAADIYSLGVILYEMLAGKVPFCGSVTEVLGKVLHVEPAPPSTQRADVDAQLEAICMKAIAKEPAERFTSMKALADALDGFLKGIPSESITTKPKAKTSDSSAVLTQVVEALSAERKKERKALEKTVTKQSRFMLFVILAAFGMLGLLIVAGGVILFFFRTPTTIVTITLPSIDPQLLKDGTIRYFLNDKELPLAQLNAPIELKVGKYTFEARRGDTVLERYVFVVQRSPDGRTGSIAIEEQNPFIPPPMDVTPKTEKDDGWVALFNGKDLAGWNVVGKPGTFEINGDAKALVAKPSNPVSRLESVKDYSDFHLRFDFRIGSASARSGVNIRMSAGATGILPALKVQVRDDSTPYPNSQTGGIYYSGGGWFKRERDDLVNARGEWNRMEVIAQGERVRVLVNGKQAVDADLQTLEGKKTISEARRVSGRIAFYADLGEVWFRAVEIKDFAPAQEKGFNSLFNGKDLTGWKTHPQQPGNWRVEGGLLVGSGDKPNWLLSERGDYTDVHVRVEAQIAPGGNSGVSTRHPFEPKLGYGYEANIGGPGQPTKTGTLFIAGRGPTVLIKEDLVPADTWFTLETAVIGNRIVVRVNGKVVVDYTDKDGTHQRGHIALQMHDRNTTVRFRKVETRELKAGDPLFGKPAAPAGGLAPLFRDGLAGWEGGPDIWKATDGLLIGTPPAKATGLGTFLVSPKSYKDFELTFQAKLANGKGGSGVIVRGLPGNPPTLPKGPLVKFGDGYGGWGTLTWEAKGQPRIVMDQAMQDAVAKLVKKDDFNDFAIKCVGKKITIQVNGFTTVDQLWDPLPEEGPIAFQIRYAKGIEEVQFRNVRIRELPVAKTGAKGEPIRRTAE